MKPLRLGVHKVFHPVSVTSQSTRMVILVRLYAHFAGATFLHKFAQVLPSGYQGRYEIQ